MGDLQNDLLSIIEAYIETSDMVGNVLPILLIEIPRKPELEKLLDIPWKNIASVTNILEQCLAQHIIKKEPGLHSISVLLGTLMVRHLIKQAELDLPIPPIEPQIFVENFLNGHLLIRT